MEVREHRIPFLSHFAGDRDGRNWPGLPLTGVSRAGTPLPLLAGRLPDPPRGAPALPPSSRREPRPEDSGSRSGRSGLRFALLFSGSPAPLAGFAGEGGGGVRRLRRGRRDGAARALEGSPAAEFTLVVAVPLPASRLPRPAARRARTASLLPSGAEAGGLRQSVGPVRTPVRASFFRFTGAARRIRGRGRRRRPAPPSRSSRRRGPCPRGFSGGGVHARCRGPTAASRLP